MWKEQPITGSLHIEQIHISHIEPLNGECIHIFTAGCSLWAPAELLLSTPVHAEQYWKITLTIPLALFSMFLHMY